MARKALAGDGAFFGSAILRQARAPSVSSLSFLSLRFFASASIVPWIARSRSTLRMLGAHPERHGFVAATGLAQLPGLGQVVRRTAGMWLIVRCAYVVVLMVGAMLLDLLPSLKVWP